MHSEKQHVKYRITAFIDRLHLNKRLNFQTKVTWKRNVNKVETEVVKHQDCQSIFQQSLDLQLNFLYNPQEARFDPKFTEFTITVIYQGKIKSGGSAKYDAAEIVNNNFTDERVSLPLMQCPDPEATIDVVFSYEVLGDSSRSLFNELSMLNPIGFQQDLSQIDFQEDQQRRLEEQNIEGETSNYSIPAQNQEEEEKRQSQKQNELPAQPRGKEYNKINNILDKFQTMSRRFSSSHKSFLQDQHNSTKHQSQASCLPPQQQERLRMKIVELERQLENREELISEYEKKLLQNSQYISSLEGKLQALEETTSETTTDTIHKQSLHALAESQSKYRALYQQTLHELQQLKSLIPDANFSKQDVKFSAFVQEMQAVNEVPQFQLDRSNQSEKIEALQRENVELQTKIASMSHNIAQIFNAAYDYGGAKLLDYLQGSIGLIEHSS